MESERAAAEWRALRAASEALRTHAERLCAEANDLRAHAADLRAALRAALAALPRAKPGAGKPFRRPAPASAAYPPAGTRDRAGR